MVIVDIPLRDARKPPRLSFPDCCVHCGKPKAKTMPVQMNTGAQKRGEMVRIEMDVPLCADCVTRENRIGNVTWIPFFLAGVLAFVVVFIPVLLLAPEAPSPEAYNAPFVLAGLAGLIAGIVVGSLVEFALKLMFTPLYGALLLKRPFTVVAVLQDAEDLIGLSMRFAEKRKVLRMVFENDEIAREFAALNSLEKL